MEIEIIENDLNIDQSIDQSLLTFTIMESGRWVPLIYLDEIKERNKPKNLEEFQFQMPFYLDF